MFTIREITEMLVAWSEGDREALDQIVPIVDAELRRLAKSYLSKERPGHILKTADLIQDAYLRLQVRRFTRNIMSMDSFITCYV